MVLKFPAPYLSSTQLSHTLPQVHTPPHLHSEPVFEKALKRAEHEIQKYLDSSARMHAIGALSDFQMENIKSVQNLSDTQNPETEGFDKLEDTALKDFEKRASERASKMSSGSRDLFLTAVEEKKSHFFQEVVLTKNKIAHTYGLSQLKKLESNHVDMLMQNPSDENFASISKISTSSIDAIAGLNQAQKEEERRRFLGNLGKAQGQGRNLINPSAGADWARQELQVKKLGKEKGFSEKKVVLPAKSLAVLSADMPALAEASRVPDVKGIVKESEERSIEYITPQDMKEDKKTRPFAGWDHLNLEQKINFINESFRKEEEKSKGISNQYYNMLLSAETLVKAGQNPRKFFENAPIDPISLTQAMGEKNASAVLSKVDEMITMGDFTDKIKTMPYAQAFELLQSSTPKLDERGVEDYEKRLRIYGWQINAFNNINKVIEQDPLEWAKSVGYGGVKEMSNYIADSVLDLPSRSIALQQLEKEKQIPISSILSDKEAKQFKDQFSKMATIDAYEYIAQLGSKMGGMSSAHFKDAIVKIGGEEMLCVADLSRMSSSASTNGVTASTTASTILEGSRIRKNSKHVAKTHDKFDENFSKALAIPKDGKVTPEDIKRIEGLREATLNYMAGNNYGSFTSNTENSNKVAEAFNQVSGGGLHNFHGSMVFAPWGMDQGEFNQSLNYAVREQLNKEFTNPNGKSNSFFTDPSSYRYQQVDQKRYIATADNGVTVFGKDGKPLYFDISTVPKAILQASPWSALAFSVLDTF